MARMERCRLCLEMKKLECSHIIPSMFFREVKRKSITKKLRASGNPNKILQDGLKLSFLCSECEDLFGIYETKFSQKYYQKMKKADSDLIIDSRDDDLKYFILSIAWRYQQKYYEDHINYGSFTEEENKKIQDEIEKWREMLLTKDMEGIRNIQMFLIPYNSIQSLEEYYTKNANGVVPDTFSIDKNGEIDYLAFYLKVPYFIFVCSIIGNTKKMKQYQVGKKIICKDSKLPNFMYMYFERSENNYTSTAKMITPQQIEATKKRVQKVKEGKRT